MLELDALNSMNVMIATPCYGGSVTAAYSMSMFKTAAAFMKQGVGFSLEMLSESLVTRARNRLVSKFLSQPALTHLFMIDADVGFSESAVARILLADRDVCAGVYPLKQYHWPEVIPEGMDRANFEMNYLRYPFTPLDDRFVTDEDGFADVREAPTGFMCIKRGVFQKMREKYPDLQYAPDDHISYGAMPGTAWLFFDTMKEPETHRYLSEDYAFCRRWRDIGGKVWVDVHSKLQHHGAHTWNGDLARHMQAVRTHTVGGIS